MAVQSIGTAIEIGDVAGNHLLVAAGEMAFGEVDGVGEFDDLAEEVRAGAKTLDDAGDLFASGASAPEVVGGGGFAGGFVVFCDADLGLLVFHWLDRITAEFRRAPPKGATYKKPLRHA